MLEAPNELLKRPDSRFEPKTSSNDRDVLSGLLESMQINNRAFGRFELSEPWALQTPAAEGMNFFLVAQGMVFLGQEEEWVELNEGDLVILPKGGSQRFRGTQRRGPLLDMNRVAHGANSCRAQGMNETLHWGGEGTQSTPTSILLGGTYRHITEGRHPFFFGLPSIMHVRRDDRDADDFMRSILHLLVAETQRPQSGTSLMLTRLLDVLLVHVLRSHGRGGSCPKHAVGLVSALHDAQLSPVFARIHRSLEVDWSVESMAHIAGMSRSSFASRFQEKVGEAPLAYLTRLRMTKAAEELRSSNRTIGEIASAVGYASEAAFHRTFKRYENVGPGAYRKNARRTETHSL